MSALDGDFLYQVWTFISAAKLELTLFVAALAAHFLLFGNSSPRKTKKKENTQGSTLTFSNAKELEAIFADAAKAGQHKQVLQCWAASKKLNEPIAVPLAAVVEVMQRFKKDPDFIQREICNYLSRKSGSCNMTIINDLLDSLGKRLDSDLVEQVVAMLPTGGFELDQRSYEIMLNMYFTMRSFNEVNRLLQETKQKQVPLTTRASLVIIKAALKQENFDEALEKFRELKSLWDSPAMAGPSMAPRHIVAQLVDMACKEHQLERFLPELARVPLSDDAIHLMVSEAAKNRDADLLEQVEELARSKDIAFSESTYGQLIRGYKGNDEKVEKLFREAAQKKPTGPDICLAVLSCCSQTRNFTLADECYKQFTDQIPVATLSAFIRFHFEAENYSKVCDMYEQDAAQAREKADAEGRSVLDARMERCVMNAALKCGRSVLAQSLLTDNPSDVAKHITMIRNCAAEQNLPAAMDIFASLKSSGAELNSVVYNTVLDACVECAQLEKATAWMEQMKADEMADVVSYNTLIKAHLQAGNFKKARGILDEMRVAKLQPNCITFNEIVNATVCCNDPQVRREVWSVLKEMQEAGVKPNQVTCSILLKNLNSSSPESDITQTMDLISSMDEQLDEVLLSSVVEACVRIGKADLLNTKLKQLMAGDAIRVNGSHTFGSLIKAYGHARDMNSVWRCWKEMRNRHIKPTSITVGCMIEAVVSNGDPDGAWNLIQELGEDRQCDGVLNAVIYCSVLKGFTRERNSQRVWAVYEEMQKRNIDLSIVTYNTLLDCCARCCRMDGVADILADMKKANIKPNIITYSTMLKGHCQSGDLSSAFRLIKEMKEEAGLVPDEIMYNSLLDGCAQSSLTDEGLKVLEEMQEAGVPPSNFTLSVLVKLMSRARRIDAAFDLVAKLSKKYNLQPNSHVYANLVQTCCFAKQLPRALKTLEEMIQKKVQPDKRTYAMLFRSATQQNQLETADGLVRGALGLPGALPFLARAPSLSTCAGIEDSVIMETISAMQSSPEGNKVAAELLDVIKQKRPMMRLDSGYRRSDGWQSNKGKGKGKGKGKY